jgi:hypothetical protein
MKVFLKSLILVAVFSMSAGLVSGKERVKEKKKKGGN